MAQFSLILASSSPYRQQQLRRLGINFSAHAPKTREDLIPEEKARERSLRLAQAKAISLRQQYPGAWILGSDQVCSCEGKILRKPGSPERQQQHLRDLAGREVCFNTAIALSGPAGELSTMEVPTLTRMRPLEPAEIAYYVRAEPAADCAGGFKVEGLGIRLFEWIRSDDPSALIGLPLIACGQLLRDYLPELWAEAYRASPARPDIPGNNND